jgi:DNA-binding transcriptional LysR family regulator
MTQPCLRTNSGDTCRAAALAHQGIILPPTFLVGQDLAAGTLVELMPAYRSIELGVYAIYPSRKHVAPKVRPLASISSDPAQGTGPQTALIILACVALFPECRRHGPPTRSVRHYRRLYH